MSLKAGIVGLPNVGKSTLFNAITKSQVEAANYPFATIEPNIGVVEVPDNRLAEIAKIIHPKKIVPTSFTFIDIAGLVKGASKGEGLGNQFLANISEVDAICHVVRCFENNDIQHVNNVVDPIEDIETINTELILADLDKITRRISRISKKARQTNDLPVLAEIAVLEKAKIILDKGIRLFISDITVDDNNLIEHLNFLTNKPMIYIANIQEDEINDYENNPHYQKVLEIAKQEKSNIVAISAKIESELSELDEEDKSIFMEELEISHTGLENLIKVSYDTLNLKSFFTAGVQEVRAWTFEAGFKANQCAGVIHTDFERGFIRASVIAFDDFIKYNGEQGAKTNGKLRMEGKEYQVQDGDVCHFLFNV